VGTIEEGAKENARRSELGKALDTKDAIS